MHNVFITCLIQFSSLFKCSTLDEFALHGMEHGEVSEEKITRVLTDAGVDMTKFNIRGPNQSLATARVNYRRVIILSHAAFRAAEAEKKQAKDEAIRDAEAAKAAKADAKADRKAQKVAKEAAQVLKVYFGCTGLN